MLFRSRTRYGDRNLRERAYRKPASLSSLIFEQIQRKVYSEVFVAGDLSQEDVNRARAQSLNFAIFGGNTFGTTELVYNNDTVYFAQPTLSQLIPGGSGVGTFTRPAMIGLEDTTNNPLSLTGRNALKSGVGAVLRYAQPAR